jgi:hypothetical protein
MNPIFRSLLEKVDKRSIAHNVVDFVFNTIEQYQEEVKEQQEANREKIREVIRENEELKRKFNVK